MSEIKQKKIATIPFDITKEFVAYGSYDNREKIQF